jgi:biopolymer transport protein ExbB/TolQ
MSLVIMIYLVMKLLILAKIELDLDELMKQINLRDELLLQQEMLLVQERESNIKLNKLLALENEKNEKFDKELAKSKETINSLKSSIDTLQEYHDVL